MEGCQRYLCRELIVNPKVRPLAAANICEALDRCLRMASKNNLKLSTSRKQEGIHMRQMCRMILAVALLVMLNAAAHAAENEVLTPPIVPIPV